MVDMLVFEGGIDQYSDEELLSLIVGCKKSARELMSSFTDIHALAVREEQEFSLVKGIGKQKARRLYAVFELNRRLSSYPPTPGLKISDPEVVFSYFGPLMSHLKKEVFIILPLNSANKLIRPMKISEGLLNSALVHPREVFRPAILECAASIVLVHNHPSGVRLYGVIYQQLMERT